MSDNAGRGERSKSAQKASLLAVLLVLLGAWCIWSGIRQWTAQGSAERTEQARDQLATQVDAALAAQLKQMRAQVEAPAAASALASGDAAAAAAAIREGWAGAEDVQVLPASLDTAYQDADAFGFSRLGLLEAALNDQEPIARVVLDEKSKRLGLAQAVQLGPQGLGVVYVRQPLLNLTKPFDAVRGPSSSYLGLRQGATTVVEQGNKRLADGADALARPVGATGLRLVAAVPDIEPGPMGLGAIASFIVGGLLLLIAVLALLGARGKVAMPRRRAAPEADDVTPTLSESLRVDPLPSAAKPPPVDADAVQAPAETVPEDIFRAYDIRGVVGPDLTPRVASLIGQAIGSVMISQGLRDVVVGRDGRLSGPDMANALIEGLRRTGCNVTDIGMAPTPVVYFASYHLRAGSCVAVTGSHNPPDYNGFKIVIGGETLSGDGITDLYRRISEGRLVQGEQTGDYRQQDVSADYIQRIADDVQLDRPLKIVADAGNGVAGDIAPKLLEAIGADVIPLYCDVDGTFPNHHPDPSEPHNLEDLIQTVKRFDADLGVAFDGDGDRLGVVTRDGRIIYSDRLLMLFAGDVLLRNPGALVIYDVKCSGRLSDYVLRHGGSPLMWKTGHSLIKSKMRETDAELAGEMSGHFFFKERWYGFDDGLYSAARLLEILAQRDEDPSEVFAELPELISTPEIKVPVEAGTQHALVALFVAAAQREESPFAGARLSTIDGLRADFNDGWGLLRASNTTPVLVLRFEGNDEAALDRIRALYRAQLKDLLPDQELTF